MELSCMFCLFPTSTESCFCLEAAIASAETWRRATKHVKGGIHTEINDTE